MNVSLKLTTALTAATLALGATGVMAETWDMPMAYSASEFSFAQRRAIRPVCDHRHGG